MFHYLLFDLDGTLTDSAEGITKCMQYGLSFVGIHEPDRKKLEVFVGPPLRATSREVYGLTAEEAELCLQKYRERYGSVGMYENRAYDGMAELLAELRADPRRPVLAICTGKPEVYARPIAERYGLTPYLDDIVGCDLEGKLDQKRLVVAETFRRLGIDEQEKKRAVLIGDRKEDVLAAHACGIKCLGVGYGFGSFEELSAAGADFYVPTVAELRKELFLCLE